MGAILFFLKLITTLSGLLNHANRYIAHSLLGKYTQLIEINFFSLSGIS